MPASYTFDVLCSLDGYGSFGPEGDWGGYWGKQGPEFLAHRAEQYAAEMQLVLGAATFRMFQKFLGALSRDSEASDPVNTRMKFQPTTVISSTLDEPLDWPDVQVARGDAVEIVTELKHHAERPLRSHGSLMLNSALLNAGLVDYVQVTMFPVLTGRTGTRPIFTAVQDFDLELVSERVFDGRIVELTYRPTAHLPGGG
ncbi:dihydrofolate reductase family protein [Glutamicibacter endophyticus]|uniref:dihydrofolate reductase family protein n=1 Tax=Glutamicibacter endophyticus TaxID=1522174 RepID=UPI003AF0AECC